MTFPIHGLDVPSHDTFTKPNPLEKEDFPMRALVVDDSRAIRAIIGEIMKQIGFEVSEAGNGLEALQRLEDFGPPDIVLVDWNMPEMNGLDFIKAVRANPNFADLPLMMVTTETEMERMALAFMAGVNEYVMKPFDKATILDKLQLLGIGA
jgi:two-component system, chemotaxis family, chemotaxis protein CheY